MANSSNFTINIKALFDASDVKAKVGDIQGTLSKLKLPDKLTADLNKSFANVNKALDDFNSKSEKGIKTKADASGITKSFDTVTKELTNLDNLLIKVKSQLGDGVDLSNIIKIPDSAKNKIADLQKEIDDLQKKISEINVSKLKSLEDALAKVKTKGSAEHGESALDLFKKGDIDSAIAELDKFIEKLRTFKQTANVRESVEALEEMKDVMSKARTESEQIYSDIGSKTQEQANIASSAINDVTNKLNDETSALHNTSVAASGLTGKINDLSSSQAQFVHEVDQVKSRIQYFFGLSNAINLVKRAIRSAVDTIKDLDKAMTETAVVTDFTVSDMWKQLPEYTKRANELGVTTQQAYESATLFYQQGLNTQQAAALSTETLKMARIAGLDAAEATDRMTNALRGFNMELDAQSAQRVDDVYSQLAANTASNVDEISTAMTKVASLAHSANMEFETTAAFLAQIIETTRESAETAGTALKTVVARFSEVKKLYSEDQLKGTDEEGQVIDVNKIGVALRTAGIDLNKYFLGEVGLDDIFMELASKWDTLSSVQQRYIATQAAGSRQQSRFIALMQDYARTQELVGMAYNANGASAKQFEKTQESLQSKLARLKNAWDEFLMGLTNNVMVKGCVDILTNLLNVVNKLTSAFGSGVGSILKWVAALSGLAGLRQAFSAGGIGTKVIGGIMGNSPVANTVRQAFGLGKVDKETGVYSAFTNEKKQPIGIFGGGGIFGGWRDSIQKFKEQYATTDPVAYQTFKDIVDAGETDPYYLQQMKQYAPTKTLFGALGNKFKGTKAGGIASSALAKLGVAGGSAEAVSGAAALAATIGTITVAATAAAVAIKAIYDASPQGQLKNAQKVADAMQDVASHAQDTATNLKKAQSSIKDYNSAVNEAATTSGRNEAIQSRNEYIQSLLEQDAAYAQYLSSTFENGQLILTLDEDALANAANQAAEAAVKAAVGSTLAQATVAGRQANVYQSKINTAGVNLEARTIRDYSDEGVAYQRTMTDAEYAKYAKLAVDASAANTQMQNYAKQAYAQMIDAKALGDELADQVASAMALSFDETDLVTSNWSFLRSRSHWQEEYLKVYGTEADSSMQTADIARAARQGQQTTTEQEQADELTALLSGSDGRFYQQMLDAFTGAADILDIDDEATIDQVLQAIGINDRDQTVDLLDALYDKHDLSALQEFTDTIKKQNIQNKKNRQQREGNIFEQALHSGRIIDTAFQDTIKGLDTDRLNIVSDIVTQAAGQIGNETLSNLIDELPTMDMGSLEELQSFFKDFSLDNPIQALDQLNNKLQTVNKNSTFGKILLDIQETNKALFDSGNLVQSFFLSDAYDSLSQSVEGFIKENGKVTAKNIDELADSCGDLKKLIDNNIASAQGLAEAFNLFEDGTVPIDAITSSLLAALSAGESFDTLMGKVQEWIENFDEGPDMAEGTEHIIDVLDKAGEYVSDWQFGNKPLENIYNHIFGEDAYDEYMKNNWGKKTFDQIEQDLTGNINKIKKWAENEGEGALAFLAKNKKAGITTNGDGTYNWDLSKYAQEADPVQAAINDIATSLGVAEDAARAFIEAWGSHMWDLGEEWDNLNFDQKMKAYAKDLGENTVITQQELNALVKTTKKSEEEITAALEQASGHVVIAVDWTDGKGANLTGDELLTKVKDTLKDLGSSYQNLAGKFAKGVQFNGIPNIDADQLNKYLVNSLKLTPAQATQVADDIASSTQKKLTKTIKVPVVAETEDKKIVVTEKDIQIEADSMAGLTAAENLALEKANYEAVGQLLAETPLDGLTSKVGSAISDGASAGITGIQSALDTAGFHATVTLTGNYSGVLGMLFGQGATGGIVGSYAKGSENFHIQPGTALTGEEGPELIWNKEGGYSYLTGENGPEFQNLQPGDRIFNAAETRKILRNSTATGGVIDSYASGGWKPSNDNNKGGGSGSGSSDKDEDNEWKNEIDWLYNVVQNIEELERQQNILQEEYNDLLTDQNKTGQDLYKMLIKQLGNLYAQLDHQTYALEKREQEMREFMDTTNDKDEYLWYNWNDRTIEIDWDKIDQITDEEEYNHIKELIDQAEDIQDKMDDAEDAIIDINNSIQDLENIWRDTFTDFEDRVLKAVIKMYQTVIDNYSELNDTLNDSNTAILDAINKEISLQRQIRDNTKTEEEIANDEAQLAYLRRDTTGGNDLAALQLEKELNDQRQNYEDNLIDQAVQRLQDDNDAAAQQREKQIEIMQAQLDYQSENGEFNQYIRDLMDTAIDGDGHLATDSDLYKLLAEQENADAMTKVGREVWEEELNGTFKEVMAFLLKEQGEAEGTYFTAVTAAFQGVQDQFDKFYHGSYSQGSIHNGSSSSSSGGSSGGSGGSKGGNDPPPKEPTLPATTKANLDLRYAIESGTYGSTSSQVYSTVKTNTASFSGNVGNSKSEGKYTNVATGVTYDVIKKKVTKAATGGLFTTTGLMQIDGTAKAPEYVLNAKQTDAFLRLADVLPAAMNNTGSSVSNTFGATTNNIVINVDKIDSDYSVDQMVARVKESLFESGSYRNNNVLNFLR